MQQECTVQDHVTELVTAVRRAWLEGRRVGRIEGEETGQRIGELIGFDRGARSTTAYQVAAQTQYRDGYVDRISDELAHRGEAAK